MPLLCLLLIVVAFIIACPLARVAMVWGRRVGQLDVPDAPGSGGRKSHARPIPNTGGVAIFAAVMLPMLATLGAVWLLPEEMWTGRLSVVRPHLEGLRGQSPMAAGVMLAALVIHILGIIDDRKRIGPFIKLAVQAAIAAMLTMLFDVRVLDLLSQVWGTPGYAASVLISIAWIVVVTNAMNFLDNMDGLAGGVGVITASLFLAHALLGGQWFVAATAALIVGALLGFLVFNFPNARLFMGDGGSLVLGLLLAVISIRITYYAPGASTADASGAVRTLAASEKWWAVLTPLVILAIPLYDFTSVTLIRLVQGKSPFVGDQQHFSHRLVTRGVSKRSAVMLIWMLTLLSGAGGAALGHASAGWAMGIGAFTAIILATLAIMERGGR